MLLPAFDAWVRVLLGFRFRRDDLVEVFRAMLSMHRSPRPDEDGEEAGGSQDEIQGVPRVLTIIQVCLFVCLFVCLLFVVFVVFFVWMWSPVT